MDPRDVIMMVNLMFAAKFILILVLHLLSPITLYNILIWDRAVLEPAMFARFDIYFARLLISIIH